ncbi:lysine-specific demethylase 4A [Salarias fasciatus]|uniref:lysine-specific demethylase 4A n=1 Tax=Salarias fasciatus TaxID=181472 RepID=UPI0011764F08|nr:lysine-specific demethylase 4A [Salarias fasciatus]
MTSATRVRAESSRVMTFHPSREEFRDFGRYVAFMESQGAHRAGMARVVPPKGWSPRRCYDDVEALSIPAPLQQVVTGQAGLFTLFNIQKKPLTVQEFRKTSGLDKFRGPSCLDAEELERKFWKTLTFDPPLYGADVSGTLYDPDVTEWNVGRLDSILDAAEDRATAPLLNFGMWKSAAAWHTEDMDLYGISYLHFGEPRTWYAVPPEHGKRLERLAKGFFPGNAQSCAAFLRHRMTLISPRVLRKYGVAVETATQEAGQFVVTFPFCYHAGFNHGFNVAESANFATRRWIDYGKRAALCSCRQDGAHISMDVFVRRFQPERYERWRAGKDLAPVDHSGPAPEAAHVPRGGAGAGPGPDPPPRQDLDEEEGAEPSKTSMSRKESQDKDGAAVKPSSTRTKKTSSRRRSPSKKAPAPAPATAPPEEAEPGADPAAATLFQRTLSPADVLHVHSYAKGDYEDDGAGAGQQGAAEPEPDVGGPPLVKEQSHDGDQGCHEEPPLVEPGGLQGEPWAKPLAHLWQNNPPSLKKEREYNRRAGSTPPYCSVCSLFSSQCSQAAPLAPPPARTKPLIPESCFSTTTEEDSRRPPPPAADGTSALLSCSRCSVRVHASCYGVDPSSVGQEWECSRCKADAVAESCCLCALRGGALQETTNNKWVHVLCAVAVLEARFVNVTERRPVDLSGIPLQRFKLKCYYCKKRLKKASGCCVQCSHGRCPTAYHPTCAQAAGVLLQPDEWPFVVHVTCCRHKGPAPVERDKAAMLELAVGQKVICKHKNGRYYQCDVVRPSRETFYEVNFDDGSFSDNLFPEDIVSRDCARLGPPPPGDVVQVRWTDGLVYGAKFVSAHVIQMYLVEFEDGSQLTAKRDDVYTLEEELPKRVKSRLSKASDMRFDGIFEEKEIIRESKRQRVINSRYRGDYIEPVIYRAIME